MQSKRKPKFFWISAMAPLTSVILGSLLVYLTHAEKHGVEVVRTPIHAISLSFSLSQAKKHTSNSDMLVQDSPIEHQVWTTASMIDLKYIN